ncbi:MAG: hypothetical protein KDA89_15405 [Planctomycetaceae bacterium]|nr:hypothetical protein [Planctomycetaceae bacterium]
MFSMLTAAIRVSVLLLLFTVGCSERRSVAPPTAESGPDESETPAADAAPDTPSESPSRNL